MTDPAFPTNHHMDAAANPTPTCRVLPAARLPPHLPFPSLPTAPHPRRYFRVRGRSGRQHRQLIGQLLKLTGHEANENAVPGRGRVTCLRKRSLPEENEVKAGNSGSRNAGSHASGDCESVGTELTHGDSAHNCIP